MSPRVVSLDPRAPEEAWRAPLEEACSILRAGGLVAFPTETVYGLGGRALDPEALGKIFDAKGRPRTHPLIAHVVAEAGAKALASDWSERAARLAHTFWPGPMTLVVPRAGHVPPVLTGGGDSVAVRAPGHRIARALIATLGEPIAAPSANRYQSISPTCAAHVVKSLGARVDLVLDGGACEAGIESTVVDVRGERARVLRPGALSVAALRAIEPDLEAADAVASEDAARPSPGMDARHYAPHARVVLAASRSEALAAAREGAAAGTVGLVVRGDVRAAVSVAPGVDTRVLPDDPAGYAAALFATLHALDDAGVRLIVLEAVPEGDAWWAVADRLRRASA